MPYQRIVHVVNRTYDQVLEVMDDGIPWTIRPGYTLQPKREFAGGDQVDGAGEPKMEVVGAGPGGSVFMEPIPYYAAERAKRQNPVAGTEDPYNPTSFQTLIAVPEWGDDYSPLQQSDAIERLDRTLLPEKLQQVDVVAVRGARRAVTQRGPDGKFKTIIPGARAMVGAAQNSDNPTGLRVSD